MPVKVISSEKVVTPATLKLSKLVCPSTSKSPFASTAPVKVETPDTIRPSVSIVPVICIP